MIHECHRQQIIEALAEAVDEEEGMPLMHAALLIAAIISQDAITTALIILSSMNSEEFIELDQDAGMVRMGEGLRKAKAVIAEMRQKEKEEKERREVEEFLRSLADERESAHQQNQQ